MSLAFDITPLLSVTSIDVDLYTDVDMAADVILTGCHVSVPTLTMAKEVLERLGLPREEIEDRIHFAVTGKVLS